MEDVVSRADCDAQIDALEEAFNGELAKLRVQLGAKDREIEDLKQQVASGGGGANAAVIDNMKRLSGTYTSLIACLAPTHIRTTTPQTGNIQNQGYGSRRRRRIM